MTLTPDPYQTAVLKAANHRRRDVLNLFFDNFDANKRTVILLPGGAGSALYRADQKFDEADPTEYTYKQVWLTPGILPRAIGDGKNLPISKNGRDLSDYVIVADGDVEWFVLPYLKAMRVFRANRHREDSPRGVMSQRFKDPGCAQFKWMPVVLTKRNGVTDYCGLVNSQNPTANMAASLASMRSSQRTPTGSSRRAS